MGGEAGEGKISKTATYVWNFFCSTYKLNPPNMTEFYSIKIYSQKKKEKKKESETFYGINRIIQGGAAKHSTHILI